MSKLSLTLIPAFILTACQAPAPEAKPEAEAASVSKHEALVAAAVECNAEPECVEALKSCDVVKAIECSALIAATVAACAVGPEDPACEAALVADKASGCCDCVPKGVLRDACNVIESKQEADGTTGGTETVKVDKAAKK